MKKVASNIIASTKKIANSNFCLSLYNNSLKAQIQIRRKKGSKTFPIKRYKSIGMLDPPNNIIRKLIESGNQGLARPIHDNPIKINIFVLNLKYFNRMVIPMIKEIITNRRLKVPCTKSIISKLPKVAKKKHLTFFYI